MMASFEQCNAKLVFEARDASAYSRWVQAERLGSAGQVHRAGGDRQISQV
jgi:hypothetical protein